MSMRLNLAKIDVELLESVRANPALIGTVLFDGGQTPAGFQRETDMFGDDYRTLDTIAEGRAEAEHGSARWRTRVPR
ncbi:hypothetical protein ABZ260_04285 [Streptosporangium sp. NPDC006013]|uniref:hypothetical protein n=1 Tax=Streptosporangium sp. NPDC006013 TaxID=3155596 RepID=UPI0033B648E5